MWHAMLYTSVWDSSPFVFRVFCESWRHLVQLRRPLPERPSRSHGPVPPAQRPISLFPPSYSRVVTSSLKIANRFPIDSRQRRARKARRRREAKGHAPALSERYHRRWDARRWRWELTLYVTAADGWAETVLGQILLPQCLHTGGGNAKGERGGPADGRLLPVHCYFNALRAITLPTLCCLPLLCWYLPLKVKPSPIVLWDLISCWCSCCYCCCCRGSWYAACAGVLILLHQRRAWIIMVSDCKAMPRASLHIIMGWREDWCQMNTYYLRREQPHFQKDTDMLLTLMGYF